MNNSFHVPKLLTRPPLYHSRHLSLSKPSPNNDLLSLGTLLNLTKNSSSTTEKTEKDSNIAQSNPTGNFLTIPNPRPSIKINGRFTTPLNPIHNRASSVSRDMSRQTTFLEEEEDMSLDAVRSTAPQNTAKEFEKRWLHKNLISLTPCESVKRGNQTLTKLDVQESSVQALASTLNNMFGSFVLKKSPKRLPKMAKNELKKDSSRKGGNTPTTNASLGSMKTLSRLSSKVLKDRSEQNPTYASETAMSKRIDQRVLEGYQRKHETFINNMKILQDLSSQSDLSHEYVMDYIHKAEARGNISVSDMKALQQENSTKEEHLKEILLHELDDILEKKRKYQRTNDMMRKEEIEEFGARSTMYFKKLSEVLIDQGNTEAALMLGTINKSLALELEDMFAAYMLQIELSKKDPETALLVKLMEERARGKQVDMTMRIRKAAFDETMREGQARIEKMKKEKAEFEEKAKKQEFVLAYLLGQIKEGLTKPMKVKKVPKKPKWMRSKAHKRRKHSLDLEAIEF